MKRKFSFSVAVLLAIAMVALPLSSSAARGADGASGGGSFAGGRGAEGKGGPVRAGAKFAAGRVLVKFSAAAQVGAGKRGAVSLDPEKIMQGAGATSSRSLGRTGIELLDVGEADIRETVEWLRSQAGVEYAEPDYVRSASLSPNDPYYAGTVPAPAVAGWNMRLAPANGGIDMPNAWDITTGSASVIVAILDTGVAYRNSGSSIHKAPDIGSNFVAGYDFINSDPYADDDHGHGTHVCGTVAQSTNNGSYAAGIAFSSRFMPVKVLDDTGNGLDSQLIEGIVYAADHGASVINMSLGGPDANVALHDACDYAYSNGVVVAAASGNSDLPAVEYPAAYDSCIAVGATGRLKNRTSYSNYGPEQDVVAPGGDSAGGIYQVTYRPHTEPSAGDFTAVNMTGTSMATPHVSAVAALVKSHHPTWTSADIRGAITSACYDLGAAGWDEQFGWGLLDARAALLAPEPTAVSISSVSPAHAKSGNTAQVTISGADLSSGDRVMLERESEPGVPATNSTASGTTRLTCDLDLDGAQPGIWDVVVESDAARDVLPGGFVVDNADNKTWYLAEGSTAHGFEEFILVQNPNGGTATATVTLMAPDGALPAQTMTIPGNSRATMRVNDVAPDVDVSARITADVNIICERSMYWNNRLEGTDSIGVQSPSYTWHLAEGTTGYGYETFLLVQNPTATEANISVIYMTAAGPVEKEPFAIPGHSRFSINVADDLPDTDMSFMVYSDKRIIAERSMYWDGRRGGHASTGTTMPAMKWYLAEGSTDWGYTEYVLIENPNDSNATVTLTYMTPTGAVPQPSFSVAAGSRKTVRVNDALPSRDVSVQVAADKGIVAERAMYWNNGTGKAGHDAIGVPQARTECFLAEGSTDWGFEEWILVQNPNSSEIDVGIDYMTESGLVRKNVFQLAGNSRVTVHVNDDVPGVDTSARVYSDKPIIAERSMYWQANGGGHVSTGLMK